MLKDNKKQQKRLIKHYVSGTGSVPALTLKNEVKIYSFGRDGRSYSQPVVIVV
jgi:hypothetical protein